MRGAEQYPDPVVRHLCGRKGAKRQNVAPSPRIFVEGFPRPNVASGGHPWYKASMRCALIAVAALAVAEAFAPVCCVGEQPPPSSLPTTHAQTGVAAACRRPAIVGLPPSSWPPRERRERAGGTGKHASNEGALCCTSCAEKNSSHGCVRLLVLAAHGVFLFSVRPEVVGKLLGAAP